jgi:hypothetical protein
VRSLVPDLVTLRRSRSSSSRQTREPVRPMPGRSRSLRFICPRQSCLGRHWPSRFVPSELCIEGPAGTWMLVLCGLTFELTGPRRQAPKARAEMMHHVPQLGLTALAVAGPVERVVRRRRAQQCRDIQSRRLSRTYKTRRGCACEALVLINLLRVDPNRRVLKRQSRGSICQS